MANPTDPESLTNLKTLYANLDKKYQQRVQELNNMVSAQGNLYRFQEKIEQQKTIYAQIADVGHRFNQSLDLLEVFNAVSRICVDLLNFERFALLLPDAETGELKPRLQGGYYLEAEQAAVKSVSLAKDHPSATPFLDGRFKLLVKTGEAADGAAFWRETFKVEEFCIFNLGVADGGLRGLLIVGNSKANADFHRKVEAEEELDALMSNVTSLIVGAQTTVQFMQAIQHESAQVRRLLDNMKQAVFSVDQKGLITEPESRFSKDIFGQTLAGNQVFETVFKDFDEKSETRSRMEVAFTAVFGENDLQWDLMSHNFPGKFHFHKAGGEHEESKTLKLDVQPIWDDESLLEKIMFVIEDVTEIEKLEKQISKERFEIEAIQQILRNDLEDVRDFFNRSADYLWTCVELLDEPKFNEQNFNVLMRNLHTLKGNSRLFGFNHISKTVHEAESQCLELKTGLLAAAALPKTSLYLRMLELLARVAIAFQALAGVGKKVFNLDTDFETFIPRLHAHCAGWHFPPEESAAHVQLCADLGAQLGKAARNQGQRSPTVEIADINMRRLRHSIDSLLSAPTDPQRVAELSQSYRRLMEAPLMPYLQKFEGLIRDMSADLAKSAKLNIVANDVSVPRSLLSEIQDIVVQILRNAIDHGLELPAERAKIGKPEAGQLDIICRDTGTALQIVIKDDGRGIDPAKLAASAVGKGLVSSAEVKKLSDQEKIHLIFLPGFSSRDQTTDFSGRGVGMDIVQATVQRLKGAVQVSSKVGQGTEFTIELSLNFPGDMKTALS